MHIYENIPAQRCGLLLEPLLIREQLKEEVQVTKIKSPAERYMAERATSEHIPTLSSHFITLVSINNHKLRDKPDQTGGRYNCGPL